MAELARSSIDLDGRRLSVLRGGSGRESVLFLHGGVPGRTLYCSGAHIWGPALALAAEERAVVAPDLPGFGDSTGGDEPYRVDAMADAALALVQALKCGPCHVVGHDEGGLIALAMVLAAPSLIRSVAIVASPAAAPTGDSIENLTLACPPAAPWSRSSQAWALERVSYNSAHIDDALLDRCVACAGSPDHRRAVERAAAGEAALAFAVSAGKAKAAFYAACREGGVPVPVQIVWGANDPMTTIEHGRVLFAIVAERQRAAHFHLINQAGNLPFREHPDAFHGVTAAFQVGLLG